MDSFAERSMVAYRLEATQFRKRDVRVSMDDLSGDPLCDWVLRYSESFGAGFSEASRSGRYFRVVGCSRRSNGVLVNLASGTAGELRRVYDVESGAMLSSLKRSQAPTVETRVFVTAERTSAYALVMVEHSASGAGDTAFLRGFKGFMTRECRSVTLDYTAEYETEAVSALLGIRSFEFVRTFSSNDVADGVSGLAKEARFSVSSKRGRYFPAFRFIGRDAALSMGGVCEAIGITVPFPDIDGSDDAVYAEVVRRDRSVRKVRLGDDCDFKMRVVLNERGRPELSDEAFVDACLERAEVLWERNGV